MYLHLTALLPRTPSATAGIVRVVRFILCSVVLAGTGTWSEAAPSGPEPIANYVLVYEFYNPVLDQYFRTASADEAAAIDAGSAGPGWVRTGDNFYALPAGGHAPAVDVCRFYSLQANTHLYTAALEECEMLKAPDSGWRYEGLAFRLQTPSALLRCPPATIPVYRLYNNRTFFNGTGHRFTIDFANIAILQSQDWIYEGIAFCALNLNAPIVHPY